MLPWYVFLRFAPGNDEIVGRRVCEAIFGGRCRIEREDAGFDGVLDGVQGLAEELVGEVVRYYEQRCNNKIFIV